MSVTSSLRTKNRSLPPDRENDRTVPEEDNGRLDLGLVRWVYRYTQPHAAKRNALLLMAVIRSVQLPLMAWALGRVIDGPIAQGSYVGLVWGALGFLALAVFTQFTFHFRQRLALELGEAIVHDLRNDIFAHLQRMSLKFFGDTRQGAILSRMNNDAEAVRGGVQDVFFVCLVVLGQMLVAGGLMLSYDVLLFGIVVAMAPIVWGFHRYFHGKLSIAYQTVQESYSRLTSTTAESIQGIQVIQALVHQEANSASFRRRITDHARYNVDVERTAGMFLPLLELSTQVCLALLIVVGGYRVLAAPQPMALGDLIQFLFLANVFLQPIRYLGDQYSQALAALAGAKRVQRFLATEPAAAGTPGTVLSRPLAGSVRFEDVEFAYEADRPVLRKIRLAVEPGQTVALVGHTGSGKTTLVNLLARFYAPTAGRILIDGHDLAQFDVAWFRRHLGIVLQQNFLFSGTVLENIRVGRPAATAVEVRQSLSRLGCLDLIDALPEGIDTPVGESGGRLSLGQRQLVCFARAMLADPRILILDEATSSIDLLTERRIQAALARLLAGRTSFVVAHRLQTIENADLVVVLDHGRIVEQGRPEELRLLNGPFARLSRRAAPQAA